MMQYPNGLEYYNYVNNNYNQPGFKEDVDAKKLYEPYEGFMRGNMFPKLYNGYKLEKPIVLQPKTEQEEILIYLDALCFAAHDISLYLDIYPKDKDMIQAFAAYTEEANRTMAEYQKKYGPLVNNSEANTVYPWAWDKEPWPWEKM